MKWPRVILFDVILTGGAFVKFMKLMSYCFSFRQQSQSSFQRGSIRSRPFLFTDQKVLLKTLVSSKLYRNWIWCNCCINSTRRYANTAFHYEGMHQSLIWIAMQIPTRSFWFLGWAIGPRGLGYLTTSIVTKRVALYEGSSSTRTQLMMWVASGHNLSLRQFLVSVIKIGVLSSFDQWHPEVCPHHHAVQ